MGFFRAISRVIARFNNWIGPTIAAESMVRESGMGGTHVDPLAMELLKSDLDKARSDE